MANEIIFKNNIKLDGVDQLTGLADLNAKTLLTKEAVQAIATGAAPTINDASDETKGIAKFSSTYFTVNSGNVTLNTTNVPTLTDGKLSTSVIPEIAITRVFTATSTSERDALTAQTGDVCIVTTGSPAVSTVYMKSANDSTGAENGWQKLSIASGVVNSISVNGASAVDGPVALTFASFWDGDYKVISAAGGGTGIDTMANDTSVPSARAVREFVTGLKTGQVPTGSGGVTLRSGITAFSTDSFSVDNDNGLVTLKPAGSSTLGGVKVSGNGLSVDNTGLLSATRATAGTIPGSAGGATLGVAAFNNNSFSVSSGFVSLEKASASKLGGVIVDHPVTGGLTVNSSTGALTVDDATDGAGLSDATNPATKGIAAFNSKDFSVSGGFVRLRNACKLYTITGNGSAVKFRIEEPFTGTDPSTKIGVEIVDKDGQTVYCGVQRKLETEDNITYAVVEISFTTAPTASETFTVLLTDFGAYTAGNAQAVTA